MSKFSVPIRFWPTGLLSLFTVFIAVDLAFVTMAFRHAPQLVSEHYYAEGSNLRELAMRKAASDAAGWQVQAVYLPRADSDSPLVELKVRDQQGAPCDSLSGTAAFYRPSERSLDVSALLLHYSGTGRYLAVLPHRLAHGAWQVVAHLTHGKQECDVRVSLFAEQ